MNNKYEDFFNDFMGEFNERLRLLLDEEGKDEQVYQALNLLLEYMELKYSNKLKRLDNGSIISKFIPFFNPSTDFDPLLETKLNSKLDRLVNGRIAEDHGRYLEEGIQLPQLLSSALTKDLVDFSKTNIPKDIELSIVMAPLQGKNQDHCDFKILNNGGIILIVCDGVSGEGAASKEIAELIPSYLFEYIDEHFPLRLDAVRWENLIQNAVKSFIASTTHQSGASTLLISYLSPQRSDLFVAWLGDGNILCFNKELTGYGKLLIPHQNSAGKLSGVITTESLIGKLSTNHLRLDGGTLILSTDGFNLTNGRLLKHFYQNVLKSKDLQTNLIRWTNGSCCESLTYHPEPMDDRSMIILRW